MGIEISDPYFEKQETPLLPHFLIGVQRRKNNMANIKNMPEFVNIYALVDPCDNQVRYVGWCVDIEKRLKYHLSASSLKNNTHKNFWIKQLLSLNLNPRIELLEIVSSLTYQEKEREWIAFYGRENLTNGTDGGEGSLGRETQIETRNKISSSNKGKIPWNKGIPWSEEIKSKNSLSHIGQEPPNKGVPMSEDQKHKLSVSKKGKPSPIKGIPMSEEAKNNKRGKKRGKNTKSKYVGVTKSNNCKNWVACVYFNGKRIHLGSFSNEVSAALAYNKKVLELFGENARINIIPQEEIDALWEME
jgi:group I intron endonuclease